MIEIDRHHNRWRSTYSSLFFSLFSERISCKQISILVFDSNGDRQTVAVYGQVLLGLKITTQVRRHLPVRCEAHHRLSVIHGGW